VEGLEGPGRRKAGLTSTEAHPLAVNERETLAPVADLDLVERQDWPDHAVRVACEREAGKVDAVATQSRAALTGDDPLPSSLTDHVARLERWRLVGNWHVDPDEPKV
jgi:hypothetical protein